MDAQVWDSRMTATLLGLTRISALASAFRVCYSQSFISSMASIFHDIAPPYHRASQVTSLPRKEISFIYEATSILTRGEVEKMKLAFPRPNYYQYGLPDPGSSAVDYIDRKTLCIPLEHFTRGLRLPLPTVLVQVLNRHDFLLAQLTPNAISYILVFIILCEKRAVHATSFLFDTLFFFEEKPGKTRYCTVKPRSGFKPIQDLLENPCIWKQKFITV
ncbi:hypothetical protein Dimus_024622 [Dionaea muscipula]